MEGEHDKEEFGNMCFHSPNKDSRDPHSRTDRITDSVSRTHMSSPSADLPLYETSNNGTSLAPSFSSENIRLGKEDERQVAFPASTDLSQSTSDRIRNIALRKLQLNGYIQGMAEEPSGELVFSCLKCDESCLGKRAAMNHVFTFHPELEPYDCQVCTSSFRSKNSLKLHYMVKHIRKRMACDVCDRRFSDPSLFKSHRFFHELESYICSVCSEQFSEYFGYKKHMRSHKEHHKLNKCGFCLKGFYTKKRYWRHMERHSSNSKRFDCSRCNETFVMENVLEEHWNSHVDQLPHYLCMACQGCDWLYYTKKKRFTHWHTLRKLSGRSVKKLLKTFKQTKQFPWNVTVSI